MNERIKETSIALIQKQIKSIETLKGYNVFSNEKHREKFYCWKDETADTLKNIFGKDSDHIQRFGNIGFPSSFCFYSETNITTSLPYYNDGLIKAKAILLAAIKEINNFGIVKHENQENDGGIKIINQQFTQALAQMNVQNTL